MDLKKRELPLDVLGDIPGRLVLLVTEHQAIMAGSRRTALAAKQHCQTIASDLNLLRTIYLPRDQVIARLQVHRESAENIRVGTVNEMNSCTELRQSVIELVADSLVARAELERVRGDAEAAAETDASIAQWALFAAKASLLVVVGGAACILTGCTAAIVAAGVNAAVGGGIASVGAAGTGFVFNEFSHDRNIRDQQLDQTELGHAQLFWEHHLDSIESRLTELQSMIDTGAVNMFNGNYEGEFWNEIAHKMQDHIDRLGILALNLEEGYIPF
ncbi:hypothetical protein HDU98_004959, partial [Podochytrium sp. JEL0797]